MEENQFILVQDSRLQSLEEQLRELTTTLESGKEEEFLNRWVEGTKVPELLGISNRTWQAWRNQRVIPFSQYGRQIWVKAADIESFLQSYQVERKAS